LQATGSRLPERAPPSLSREQPTAKETDVLSISHHVQAWQERELADRQDAAEDLHLLLVLASIIVVGLLVLGGMGVAIVEVAVFGMKPSNLGAYLFAGGIVFSLSLIPGLSATNFLLERYQETTRYLGASYLRRPYYA
jgi:hypothetical protein